MVGGIPSHEVRAVLYQKRGLLLSNCGVSIETSSIDPSCQLRQLMVELFILYLRHIDHPLVLLRHILVSINKRISSVLIKPVIFHQLSWVDIFDLFIVDIKNVFALETV